MKKLLKLLRIYYWPVWLWIMIVLLGVLSLIGYFELTKDINNTYLSGLNGLIVILTTSAGIFVPLLINKNWEKSDEKEANNRELKFVLGSIWNELNKNKVIIEHMRMNFTFKGMLNQITDFDELIVMTWSKLQTVEKICDKLSNNYFLAALNSKTFIRIDSDETYNAIFQVYENISSLKLMLSVACEDFKLKNDLIKFQNEKLSPVLENQFRQLFIESLTKIWREILFNKKIINLALENIDNKLTSLNVNATRELMNLDKMGDLPNDSEIVPDEDLF